MFSQLTFQDFFELTHDALPLVAITLILMYVLILLAQKLREDFIVVFIVLTLIFIVLFNRELAAWPKVRTEGDDLHVEGSIEPAMARAIIWYLFGRENGKLSLSSEGGRRESAIAIVRLVNAAKFRIHLRKGEFCGSSCVYIYVYAAERVADDAAILGFHAGRPAISLSNNKHYVDRRGMEAWAAKISSSLPDYFHQCTHHPLDREPFFLISFAQIDRLDSRAPERSCDEQAKFDTLAQVIAAHPDNPEPRH